MDFSDEPAPSDAIVVLAGGYARPFKAAELYRLGLAPELWLSRPMPEPAEDRARAAGVPLPLEEDVNRLILLKGGVPAAKIHLYGHAVLSTADEARSFGAEFSAKGKKILVVTSRYHARRAKMIFSARLAGTEVRSVGSEGMPRRWWRDKFLAQAVVMEAVKTLYFLLGGRFLGPTPVA